MMPNSLCDASSTLIFASVSCLYLLITTIGVAITAHTTPVTPDLWRSRRGPYTTYVGRHPNFNLFLTTAVMIIFSSLSAITPCLDFKPLAVDQNLESYIKSDNYQTDCYDAVNAAVEFGQLNADWPSSRRFTSSGQHDADWPSSRRLSAYSGHITFVYIMNSRPNDIFTETNLRSIEAFESAIQQLPSYASICRPQSFYTSDPADSSTCAQQATAISSWFFSPSSELFDIPATLTTAAQNGLTGFMDVFFSLDNLGSNLTRSSFYFDAPDEITLQKFYMDEVVLLANAANAANSPALPYQIVYYDNDGYIFGVLISECLYNDIRWSAVSFFAVFVFVFFHTNSFLVSFFGMIGVTASIPISLWIYKDIIGIDHMSILNFLSLFVIMGVGADDMFVFFDAYHSVCNEDATGTLQEDIPARLGATFSRAISAMLVTSVSTAASFFSNIVSSLPVIQEFGIFMGLVIVVNFAIIVVFFPSIVIVVDRLPSICGRKKKPRDESQSSTSAGNLSVDDFTRESFLIDFEKGWNKIDVFLHNYWAPAVYKLRFPITGFSLLAVVYAAYLSAVNVVPADKQPSFFPADHNNGLLEIIGQDYVAGRSIKLDDADAAAWGLITVEDGSSDGSSEGSSDGGSSGGGAPETCPVLDGRLCSGSGTCNSLTVICVCFTGFRGADCSSPVVPDGVVGDVVPSSTVWLVSDTSPHTVSLTLVNTGGTALNWYFQERDAYITEDTQSVPAWLTFTKYSGSIAAGSTDSLAITVTPSEMEECSTEPCVDEFSWTFRQTGLDEDGSPMRVELIRFDEPETSSPTEAPVYDACSDGEQNGEEIMVDCGGSLCAGCPVGGSCAADADCESGAECASNVCIALPTSSPTPSPTALACNDVSCNKHGRCTNDGTCDCYKGFKGQFCEVVEKTEKNRHVEVDVYWGVSGIDRAAADGDFEAGKPVFDQSFQLTGEAQLFLKDSCALFRSANSTLVTFPEGSDWVCMFEVLDSWLVSSTGSGLPLEEDALFTKIAGTGEDTGDGFLSVSSVQIDGVHTRTDTFADYIGLDRKARRITWARVGIDTSLEDSMDATKGKGVHAVWETFLKEVVDKAAPEELGKSQMSCFLWVRISTELTLVRSTIFAWAISNASAFVVILLFTRSLYIACMTTLCIFCIIVCLAFFMIYVMQWPFGAMEALSITIFVGLACDYCLHVAHAFMHSGGGSGKLKAREALTKVGKSVFGAALTTVGSSACLLFCVIVFFEKMGIIIIINAVGSLFFALCFFPALLSIGGGGAQRGDVRVEARDEEEASIAVEVEMTAGEPRQRGPSGSSLW